jgi:aryl-alcohol dehydrogenase-like predicted oxidoreductase
MAMQNRILGRTGVSVSPVCMGAMMFGSWGNSDEADCIRIIHRALDAGINFIDTADVYSEGESEKIVGKALAGRRDDVVLATKFFMPMGGADPNMRGSSRRWIIREVENSLRRLGTDYIDLYQVHLERFVTEQPPYSILVRGIEADVLPTARRHGMGILSYSPLAGGWLSGRWRKDAASAPASAARPSARFDMTSSANQRKLEVVEELAQLADKAGLTLIELAIAFVINHPAVTAAIIGPRTMEQLESQLPGAEVTLTADILDHIDQLVAPGVTINPDDNSYGEAELTPVALRRTP